jgi:hypothetical protein
VKDAPKILDYGGYEKIRLKIFGIAQTTYARKIRPKGEHSITEGTHILLARTKRKFEEV